MRAPRLKDYPKQWVIGDEIWEMRFVKKCSMGDDVLGECDPSNMTFSIKLGQGRDQTLDTVIHELLHCIENSWNFSLPHKRLIYKLETPIRELIKKNFL